MPYVAQQAENPRRKHDERDRPCARVEIAREMRRARSAAADSLAIQARHRKQSPAALPLMPLGIKAFEHAQHDQRPGARTAKKQVRHYERAEQTLRLPSHKASSSEHAPLTGRRASPHILSQCCAT